MNTPDEQMTDAGADPAPIAPAAVSNGGWRAVVARQPILAALAMLLLLGGLTLVVISLIERGNRGLFPNLPTFTPLAQEITSEATLVGFAELNEDPAAFREFAGAWWMKSCNSTRSDSRTCCRSSARARR
jgi:hypothetical protein